jgi:hypothetical protein
MNRWTMTLLAAAGFLLIVRGGPDVRAATNKSVMVNANRVSVYPATGQDLVLTGVVVKVAAATNAASPVTLTQLQAATNGMLTAETDPLSLHTDGGSVTGNVEVVGSLKSGNLTVSTTNYVQNGSFDSNIVGWYAETNAPLSGFTAEWNNIMNGGELMLYGPEPTDAAGAHISGIVSGGVYLVTFDYGDMNSIGHDPSPAANWGVTLGGSTAGFLGGDDSYSFIIETVSTNGLRFELSIASDPLNLAWFDNVEVYRLDSVALDVRGALSAYKGVYVKDVNGRTVTTLDSTGIHIGYDSFVLNTNGSLAANWDGGGYTISNATFSGTHTGDGTALTITELDPKWAAVSNAVRTQSAAAYGWGDHATNNYVADAPSNGTAYARQNGSWTVLAGGGDMLKATYDADTNGIADTSDALIALTNAPPWLPVAGGTMGGNLNGGDNVLTNWASLYFARDSDRATNIVSVGTSSDSNAVHLATTKYVEQAIKARGGSSGTTTTNAHLRAWPAGTIALPSGAMTTVKFTNTVVTAGITYSTSTGKATLSSAGTYVVAFSYRIIGLDRTGYTSYGNLNWGTSGATNQIAINGAASPPTGWWGSGYNAASAVVRVLAGDTIWLSIYNNDDDAGAEYLAANMENQLSIVRVGL